MCSGIRNNKTLTIAMHHWWEMKLILMITLPQPHEKWNLTVDVDVCQLCNMYTGVQASFCCREKKWWQWQCQHAKIQTQMILWPGE